MSELNTERKAIVLLASIPEEDATQLLAHFTEDELDRLSQAANGGSTPTTLEQDELTNDLVTQRQMAWLVDRPRDVSTDAALLAELATGAVDVFTAEEMIRTRFRTLEREHPERLRSLLAQERPQTVALVLAFLPPHVSAAVLTTLPTELQVSASIRVAELEKVDTESALTVADVLEERMRRRERPLETEVGGPRHLARILQATDQATEHALLENLTHEDRRLVNDVRQHLTLIRELQRSRCEQRRSA